MLTAEFLLTALVVVFLPGTGVIYTASAGLFLGGRAGLAAAAGCTVGIVPHLIASVLGLSALMHTSIVAFQVAKYIGTLYLFYLAWAMWRAHGVMNFTCPNVDRSPSAIARRGFVVNGLNPKISFFFLALVPMFLKPEQGGTMMQVALLGAVFMVFSLVALIIYGLAADRIRARVLASPRGVRYVQRSFALAFAALGLRLAAIEH